MTKVVRIDETSPTTFLWRASDAVFEDFVMKTEVCANLSEIQT